VKSKKLEFQRKVDTNKIHYSSIIEKNAVQRIWNLLNEKIMKERYAANKKSNDAHFFLRNKLYYRIQKDDNNSDNENQQNPKNERFTDEGKIIQRTIGMRLISYQTIMKLEFPRKDRINGNLNGTLFWNQE
jgi:hypothetical protein